MCPSQLAGHKYLHLCRPLPPLVAPVLSGKLALILGELSASFPPAAACLRAAGATPTPAAGGPAGAELMDDSDDDLEGESWSFCGSTPIFLRL